MECCQEPTTRGREEREMRQDGGSGEAEWILREKGKGVEMEGGKRGPRIFSIKPPSIRDCKALVQGEIQRGGRKKERKKGEPYNSRYMPVE